MQRSYHNRLRSDVGISGEAIAASFLRQKGFVILERNVRTRYGEIDIIAREGSMLVFVEVKCRTGTAYGTPEDAVTSAKLAHMTRSAEYYRLTHPGATGYRLDVISVTLDRKTRRETAVTHLRNVTL